MHQRTEGWVAGLLLATRSGGGRASPGRLATGGAHFDYLAEEVLGRLPRRHPALPARHLRAGALHAGPRRGGLGARRTRARSSAGLVDSHLFIVQAEGGWHRYHHLFHAFLRRHLAEREPEAPARAAPARGPRVGGVRRPPGGGPPLPRGRRDGGGGRARSSRWPRRWSPTPERQTLAAWLARIPRGRLAAAAAHRAWPGALLTYLAGDARGGVRGLGRRDRPAGGRRRPGAGRRRPLPLPAGHAHRRA